MKMIAKQKFLSAILICRDLVLATSLLVLSADSCAATPASTASVLSTTLPALQTNLSGDTTIEWRYANATLGTEVWLLDTAPGAQARDRFTNDPELLGTPLTESGWPRTLPGDVTVTINPTYKRKLEPAPGEIRSADYENLTGIYIITWKGKTLPTRDGNAAFTVLDSINDGNPDLGTRILQAGDHRVIALVRHPGRSISVQYQKPDPSDPVRDIKIWTPLFMGAGMGVDLRVYSEARLGPGALSAFCTEPAPGAPDPLWHPQYLGHLREDPGGVLRFMNLLAINDLEAGSPPGPSDWSDRKLPTCTLGSLVAISPANWVRHPLERIKGGGQIPYEWIFDLCRQVDKDAWVQVPHTATDEHIAGLATLAARSLPGGQRIWFEFSNELWNNYGPYMPQYKAAEAEGKKYRKNQGWGSGHLQAQAHLKFREAWLKAGRLDDDLITIASGFELSPEYNAEVLAGANAVAPHMVEALAITTYFGAGLTRELYSLPYGNGNPALPVYTQAMDLMREDLYQHYEAWKASALLCQAQGIPMIAYEGGTHILATGYGDWNNQAHASFMTFLANLHKHPLLEPLYLEHWILWVAAGGHTASLYTDIGAYGYFGYWGAKEDVTEGLERSPRYRAARTFAALQRGLRPADAPAGDKPRFRIVPRLRAEAGSEYSFSVPVAGGDGTLSCAVVAGLPPPGMITAALRDGGLLLSGIPTGPGTYRFVVRAVDGDGDAAYSIVAMTIDPRGTTDRRLLLFDPKELPQAMLGKSESREEFRTRFDVVATRPMLEDSTAEGVRVFIPFNGAVPLFATHYQDKTLILKRDSPFALSGGLSLTLLKNEFYKMNPALDGKPGLSELSTKNTLTLLWFGFRNQNLAGQVGSSLELKADTVQPQSERLGVPTRFDALLLWRREQMKGDTGETVAFGSGEDQATLVLESGGIGADQATWRFVISQKGQRGAINYYISEALWMETSAGRFSLSDFNGNPAAGKRWALFQPGSTAFAMPLEKQLVFLPVDFTQVDGVGIALQSYRFGWHYDFSISRFLAIGK